MDPDDLIKRDGAAAMERVLGGVRSLLDTLWEHERDLLPLDTPEAKAGLKARLKDQCDTIADPDIRALYWRELSERYSAFAFPKREQAEWRGGKQEWRGGRGAPPPRQSSPEDKNRLRRAAGGGARDALAAAILAGLIRHPQEIRRHADMLARAPGLDRRFDLLIDLAEGGDLDSARIATIFAEHGFSLPSPAEFANMPWPFVSDGADPLLAADALAAAIAKLVEEPAIDAAIAAATERFDMDEQQRLLARKRDIGERLRELTARARA
jgi:DNA primase